MDYSSFMSSGLLAIAPRHTHRRTRSATTNTTTATATTSTPPTIRPLPQPPVSAHRMGHTRATSMPFRIRDLTNGSNAVASGSQPRVHFASNARAGESSRAGGAAPSGSRAASDEEEPSSYLSLDDDSDSDSLPDELEDDLHATFIDLNSSEGSLLLPQLVLPDSPHEQPDPLKVPRAQRPLSSFLSFTPACSPVDSPVIARPDPWLPLPEPALREGTSRHLESAENEFEKGLQLHTNPDGETSEHESTHSDWREAVTDSFIDEGNQHVSSP